MLITAAPCHYQSTLLIQVMPGHAVLCPCWSTSYSTRNQRQLVASHWVKHWDAPFGHISKDIKVAVFGTGGMSHQLSGERAGLINEEFDRNFLEKIETDPQSLAAISRGEYIEQAGSEGIEMIMWLIMRGALGDDITRIHDTYHVPASNTAAALALFATEAVNAKDNELAAV